jgi:hypothetical protein
MLRTTLHALLTMLLTLVVAGGAAAQAMRNPPADALEGRMTPLTLPLVRIDNRELRLAPGAQIFSAAKRTVTPNQIKPDTPVRYVLDAQGHVKTVWVVDGKARGERRTAPQR